VHVPDAVMRGVVPVPWTDAERAQLRRLHDNGMSQPQIAKLMGRSKNSIHRQLANLGMVRNERNSAPSRPAQGHAAHRPPKTTLPPLPSLSMRGDGECKPEDEWPNPWDLWP
jgi:hypothetical protein